MTKWINIKETLFYDPDAESKEGKIVSDEEYEISKISQESPNESSTSQYPSE